MVKLNESPAVFYAVVARNTIAMDMISDIHFENLESDSG